MLHVHERYQLHRAVHFAETDASGAVHFTNILRYIEEAEHAFLRTKNLPVFNSSTFRPRVHISCDYRQPIRCFDEIEVRLEVIAIGNTSTTWKFSVTRDNIICAEGKMITVTLQDMPR